jgi:hypothetical protein
MEERLAPATISWINANGGDWDTAGNWSSGSQPGANDDVLINLPGVTVTHNQAVTDSIHSLTSSDPIIFSAGTLSLAAASTITGGLTFSDGTITGAGNLLISGLTAWSGGTMSGSGTTNLQGPLVLGSADGNTHAETLNGRTLIAQGAMSESGFGTLTTLDQPTLVLPPNAPMNVPSAPGSYVIVYQDSIVNGLDPIISRTYRGSTLVSLTAKVDNPNGSSTSYEWDYNSDGSPSKVTETINNPDGSSTSYEWDYNSDGSLSQVTEQMSNTDGSSTSYEWDYPSDGSPFDITKTTSNADGSSTYSFWQYNSDGSSGITERMTNADGSSTYYEWDFYSDGSLNALSETITNADGSGTGAAWYYNNDGSLRAVELTTNSDGSSTNYEWDYNSDGSLSDVITTSKAGGSQTILEWYYNSDGSLSHITEKVSNADGSSASYEWDYDTGATPFNVTELTTNADGSSATYDWYYDAIDGNSVTETITNSDGSSASYEWLYNSDGTLGGANELITNADGSSVSFEWDINTGTTSGTITNADGSSTTYAWQNVTSNLFFYHYSFGETITNSDGSWTSYSWYYSSGGNLLEVSETDSSGSSSSWTAPDDLEGAPIDPGISPPDVPQGIPVVPPAPDAPASSLIPADPTALINAAPDAPDVPPAPSAPTDYLEVATPSDVSVDTPFDVTATVHTTLDDTIDTTYEGTISIALANDPNGNTILGGVTPITINDGSGEADFGGLTLDKPGMGFTLQAHGDNVTLATTNPFDVAGSPSITLTPPNVTQKAVAGDVQPFLLGSFNDQGGEGPWSVSADVNWGDDTPDTVFQTTSTGELPAQSHSYAQVGVYTVTEKVTDTADNQSDTKTFQIVVCTPPVLTSPGEQNAIVVAGTAQPFSLGSFTDDSPNPPDDETCNVMVDWGDNSPVASFEANPGSLGTLSHDYEPEGNYYVTEKVTDTFSGLAATTTYHVGIVRPLKSPEQVKEYQVLSAQYRAAAERALNASPGSDTSSGPGFGSAFSAAALSMLSVYYGELANDPIDPNFTSIAQPNPPSYPPLTAGSGLPQQVVDALNAYINNVEQFIGFSNAVLTSVDRESGAQLAGNGYWQHQQTRAAGSYAQQLAILVSAQPTLMTAYVNAWSASGLAEMTVTASEVSNVESQIATSGLPAPVLQILSQLTDSATISQITTSLIAQDPNQAAGTFPASLVDPSFVSAEQDAGVLFQSFAPVQPGQSAGIGFWNNPNGQMLIDSFSGGPNSTALANWLATTFPNLYGSEAAANNLTGNTNAQVAAFYQSLFAASGPSPGAEVLATALSEYATTSSLGGTVGSNYGVLVTPYGLEGSFYNVGSCGAAFDMANGSDANVSELLQIANQEAVNGVLFDGNASLQNLAGTIFDGILAATPVVSVLPVNINYGTPLADTQLSGTATVNGQTVAGTFTYTNAAEGLVLSAGNGQSEEVTFTPSDPTDYVSVTASVTVNVSQASQSIDFPAFDPVPYGVPIALSASGGGSGNPVTFTLISGPAALNGDSLTFTGIGNIVVEADQAGNANCTAAPAVQRTIVVTSTYQTTASESENGTPTAITVANVLGSHYSDLDGSGSTKAGIAVFQLAGGGTWQYSTKGSNWNTISNMSQTQALLLPGNDSLRFVPAANWSGLANLYFAAWDGSQGNGGSSASITVAGGTTPFSVNAGALAITVNPAPIWVRTGATLTPLLPGMYSASSPTTPAGNSIASVFGGYFHDDNQTIAVGVAIESVTGLTSGVWQFLLSSGGLWTNFPAVSPTAALLLSTNDQIRFVPKNNFAGTVSLKALAWDGSVGIDGKPANPTKPASGAFSNTTLTATAAANNAPKLAGATIPAISVAQYATTAAITVSSLLTKAGYSDPNGKGLPQGIAVTGVSPGAGIDQYMLAGETWQPLPSVSMSSALLLPSSASLRFVAGSQTGTATLTFDGWDQTQGIAGQAFDITSTGNATAFSTTPDSLPITIATSTNQAPTLANQTLTEPNVYVYSTSAAITVSTLLTQADYVDPDGNKLPQGIAIIGATGTGATGQYKLSGGTWQPLPDVSLSSALLLPSSASLRLVMSSQTGTATLTIDGWDQTQGVAGQSFDIPSPSGGATAFSATSATASIPIVNTAPTLTKMSIALPAVRENTNSSAVTTASLLTNAGYADAAGKSAPSGIAITADAGQGTWQWLDGSIWTPLPSVNTTSAFLLPGAAQLRFEPNDNLPTNTNGSATLTYLGWDETAGAADASFALTRQGGTSAFSLASSTASMPIDFVKSAPTWLAGASASFTPVLGFSASANPTPNPAGDAVATVFGSAFRDAPSFSVGVAISAQNAMSAGSWQYFANGNWITIPTTLSAGAPLLLSANTKVRFLPTKAFSGTVSLTAHTWDGTTGSATSLSTTTLTATCLVNTAPTLS